jgi:transglutaminase-like putative cysteine protease
MKVLVLGAVVFLVPAVGLAAEPKARTFRFTYEATITGLKPEQPARVWLPVPQTTDDQKVTDIQTTFNTEAKTETEPRFGNKMLYLVPTAGKDGEIPLRVVYTIERKEVRGETDKDLKDDLERFLKPDPLTRPDGKHLNLIEGKKLPEDPMAVGKEFYDLVNGMMKYSKEGTQWGRGDVDWVCDSRFGNCTDFHSLFLALLRSQKIPGKFEIGFGLPEKRGSGEVAGYHCWAKFKPEGKGWVPVDISEANKNPKLKDYYFGNLTADRVTFTVGRDLTLAPKQDGPPLNFFVYPYVEVDGKPYPGEKIKRKFSHEDMAK